MEDAPVAEPERDVVGGRGAVGDEVARPRLARRHLLAGLLLLVGVARNQPPEPPVGHVDEPRAVDPELGHAAPQVGRAEVPARLLDRIALRGLGSIASIAIQPG